MAKGNKATGAKPTGRPTSYTDEIASIVCERIACGESVHKICAEEGMPEERTFYRWLFSDEIFRQKYIAACDARTFHMAEEIIKLSDSCREGVRTTRKADGSLETVTADMVERAKLQIDTRKWLMARMAPKKYGDKVTQEISGPNGGPLSFEALVVEATRRRQKPE